MASGARLARRLTFVANTREADQVRAYLQAVAAELGIEPETLRREAEDLTRRCAEAGARTPAAQRALVASEMGISVTEVEAALASEQQRFRDRSSR